MASSIRSVMPPNMDKVKPNGVQIEGSLVVDSLYVRGKTGFANGITTPGITVGDPHEPSIITPGSLPSGGVEWGLDLISAITNLQNELNKIVELENKIKALEQKVAALEAAHP